MVTKFFGPIWTRLLLNNWGFGLWIWLAIKPNRPYVLSQTPQNKHQDNFRSATSVQVTWPSLRRCGDSNGFSKSASHRLAHSEIECRSKTKPCIPSCSLCWPTNSIAVKKHKCEFCIALDLAKSLKWWRYQNVLRCMQLYMAQAFGFFS